MCASSDYGATWQAGLAWKDFFQCLEAHEGLDPDLESHMWLLHHLFLDAINEDAL